MANEYFSAIGSAFSDSVTGVIDDPEYTLYVNATGDDMSGEGTVAKPFKTPQRALFHLRDKFITQNGFAHIKLGAGRFVLDDSIEIRHPQGDRIGIKGKSINIYNMKSCKGYTASHSAVVADEDVDFQTQGSTAPRYYKSTITLGGGVAQTVDGININTISGISGEYLLVQDYSMRNDDDYDHSAWDFNLNGKTAKRSSLMGCNILYGANDDVTNVKMNMKYLNFPYQMKTKFQRGRGSQLSDVKDSIVRVGGCRSQETGGRDFPRLDGVGGWLLPEDTDKYFSYSSDPLENSIETNENRNSGTIGVGLPGMNNEVFFGSTAEGQTITFADELAPHYSANAYVGAALDNQKQMQWTQPKHDSKFVTLNRMTATHVKTILEFKNNRKPGILLDGAQLGYIHDIVLEGKWQQFRQGENHGGVTSENQSITEHHIGIFVRNGGNLSYDLGKTGASLAELKFSSSSALVDDDTPISSDSITISNVGINGFNTGSQVENYSYANLDDIVISNCAVGVNCQDNSSLLCNRATLVGHESRAINCQCSSTVHASRTMIAHTGTPSYVIDFALQSENYYQRKSRDNTFLLGKQIIFDKADTPLYAGLVNRWTANSTPRFFRPNLDARMGTRQLNVYDHKGSMTTHQFNQSNAETTPTITSATHGITGAAGDASPSGSHYEDASSTGYLKPFAVYQGKHGSGSAVAVEDGCNITMTGSSVFYAYGHGVYIGRSSQGRIANCVFAMNAGNGVGIYNDAFASIHYSRFFCNMYNGVQVSKGQASIHKSSIENSEIAVRVDASNVTMTSVDVREGTAMFMLHQLHASRGSYVHRGQPIFQCYNTTVPDNGDAAPKPAPANLYNNRGDGSGNTLYPSLFVESITDDSHLE